MGSRLRTIMKGRLDDKKKKKIYFDLTYKAWFSSHVWYREQRSILVNGVLFPYNGS